MFWFIVILVLIIIIATRIKSSINTSSSNSVPPNPNQPILGMVWPKPDKNNLWDTLDYFVRLAEVNSARSTDPTVVSLFLWTKDTENRKKGDFEIGISDFERLQRRYGDKIPYLLDEPRDLANDFVYTGSDPNTTVLLHSPEKIYQIILDEAPHAQFKWHDLYKDGCILFNFSFPSR